MIDLFKLPTIASGDGAQAAPKKEPTISEIEAMQNGWPSGCINREHLTAQQNMNAFYRALLDAPIAPKLTIWQRVIRFFRHS